jgi:hypothetical protein
MPDQPIKPRSISEISHLFLSSVRDKQTGGAARPVRTPPQARHGSEPQHNTVDLTPEEYAQVFAQDDAGHRDEAQAPRIPQVTAVIAQHLNGRAHERVRDYARHLAANGERIGLIEVDNGEMRLLCFERSIEPNDGDPNASDPTERFDQRFITESLDEMSWDLDRWLLVLPNLRSPEARALLKEVDHWSLLSTCDHDGVVSCYRTLKGLANVHRPRMTLALMEAANEAQAAKVHKKLCSVCLQFLGIELAAESAVRPTRAVAEHQVVHFRSTRDKAQMATGPQWQVVTEFLAKARVQAAEKALADEDLAVEEAAVETEPAPVTEAPAVVAAQAPARVQSETVMPVSTVREEPVAMPPSAPFMTTPAADDAIAEVIDLPNDAADERTVLSAILGGSKGELIECPVRPPMCPDARLAVTRDHGLVLVAVARRGLRELRAIAQAYRWLTENRPLIAMAVPQLSIDAHRHPKMRLLVDHADLSAEVLAPMLETSTVSIQAYRKLRWAGRTGLLLDAA